MSKFVDADARVAVEHPDDPGNIIYIREKMGLKIRKQALDQLTRSVTTEDDGNASVRLSTGSYQTTLMKLNILAWEGPGFGGTPCTPANIERLDLDDPLVALALEEIVRRNPISRPSPDPKSLTASGSSNAGALPSTAS